MNVKVLLFFSVVLILVYFATESEAFLAGGDKSRKKFKVNESMKSVLKIIICFFVGVSLMVSLNRGSY